MGRPVRCRSADDARIPMFWYDRIENLSRQAQWSKASAGTNRTQNRHPEK